MEIISPHDGSMAELRARTRAALLYARKFRGRAEEG